jgi:hypothetical protein
MPAESAAGPLEAGLSSCPFAMPATAQTKKKTAESNKIMELRFFIIAPVLRFFIKKTYILKIHKIHKYAQLLLFT